jgi:hypothetical protein
LLVLVSRRAAGPVQYSDEVTNTLALVEVRLRHIPLRNLETARAGELLIRREAFGSI